MHYIAKSIEVSLQIIGLFQSPPWPQVYKIKHLGMQNSTNMCKRMGRSQELSEFKRGTMIGCHLCNPSVKFPCY
ncbi:unnamed protein product [Staurois parvus]|uniref:Uncharacterized protein n=1 Tax=Staurois parvus TaxID=386267 RepID=A0ABN9H486_9NEOB|nr:unnamed protein product [Staurois parvus]